MSRPFYLSLRGFEDPESDDTSDDTDDETTEIDSGDTSNVPGAEAIAARAAARAERKAKKDLAKSLGFDSIKAMTESFETMRQQEQERLSEEEQRLAQLTERENELNARQVELARQNRELQVQTALSGINLRPERVKQALTLIRAELAEADLDVEDEQEIISEAVANLKTATPEWFGTANVGSNDASDDGKPPSDDGSEEKTLQAKIKQDLIQRGMTFD